MNIEYTPVKELRPYAANARTHSRKQIRQIAKSIERFGFCNPVLIDDSNQIVAGHGRVEAAKIIGIEDVPTVRLSHLSETDKRAYILADNKLAREGWLGPGDSGDRTAGAYRARRRDRTDRLRNCRDRHLA